ncbi:MAG TPA: glycosyl hydrolase, partial [Pedobacter sp.]|uniref:glycosyl hydrolase n=1 Tax=Pedobacter sp. TaxID=1411316 RepID=UPI002C8128F2
MKRKLFYFLLIAVCVCWSAGCSKKVKPSAVVAKDLKSGFLNPPDSAKSGVYWYFMDGNLNRESITADLESMKKAGLSSVVFLEVNVGVPRGKVDFLSAQWQELFVHAVKECERLNIEMTLGIGPGWTGSGGPWVKASESMQHLVAAAVQVDGDNKKKIMLPVPKPMPPYFGEGGFTEELKKQWNDFYKDVAVLAYPTPSSPAKIKDVEEKALYYRAPYSSAKGVKQYLPSLTDFEVVSASSVISKEKVIDLTGKLQANGELDWDVPNGKWTIVRYGLRNNGAVTRPAPYPGLGFEADKFDTLAISHHLDQYIGTLLNKIGKKAAGGSGGLKRLHMDSWEMGAQNWTGHFREEFIKRRGYDPLPYYPVYAGNVVESVEISERFLWDLRQTSQELVLENHAGYVKKYAHRNGMSLSIEPYDMNPNADLELGAVADVPMCEFWSAEFGYNTSFSCIEAASIAHVNGRSLVPAEAFTAESSEGWKQHPASMKNQGDWAFATGINRFVFHTFQNQMLPDSLKPGMTMGPYGVHWDRSQTWWSMVGDYHRYLSRSQYILQQGNTVADVLYLTPEGSPHVFR